MIGVKDILQMAVAPALGCTEPSAIALAAAAEASLLPTRDADRIEIGLDPNIFKNGLAVFIPGAQGESGLELAAALGAYAGEPIGDHAGQEVRPRRSVACRPAPELCRGGFPPIRNEMNTDRSPR